MAACQLIRRTAAEETLHHSHEGQKIQKVMSRDHQFRSPQPSHEIDMRASELRFSYTSNNCNTEQSQRHQWLSIENLRKTEMFAVRKCRNSLGAWETGLDEVYKKRSPMFSPSSLGYVHADLRCPHVAGESSLKSVRCDIIYFKASKHERNTYTPEIP